MVQPMTAGLDFSTYLSPDNLTSLIRIVIILTAGLPLIHILSKAAQKFISTRIALQKGAVAAKFVYYTGIFILIFSVLNEMGFKLNTLLGAAGIFGIAIGFASQTSISNIISGLFIIVERPFNVTDIITVENITGEVIAIDLLSIKLKTDDNRYVRIPNEVIIKNKLINVTRFTTRRLDIHLGIAYKEDIGHVRATLLDIATKISLCLKDPAPQVIFSGFGRSSIDLLFAVWIRKEDWLAVNNLIFEEIKKRFIAEGIEIPYPHLTLVDNRTTASVPIDN